MISFFTDPYDGELITHAIARCIEYQKSSLTSGLSQLFSTDKITACLSFGNNIDDLVAALGGEYTSDYLINNHTILPYYKLFCSHKKYQALYNYITRGNRDKTVNASCLQQISQCLKKSMVYCEECVKEDIRTQGEPYLHREHYLYGANMCYKHKIPLMEYEIAINNFKTTLSQINIVEQLESNIGKNNFRYDYNIPVRQTELAVKILNSQVDIYREDLTEVYISRLKELGLIVEEYIDYPKIENILLKLYGKVGINILKPYLDSENIVEHLFLNTKNFIDPNIHLLFIKALWEDEDVFINACIEQYRKRQNSLNEVKQDLKERKSLKGEKAYSKTYTSTIYDNDCIIKVMGTANRYIDIIKNELVGVRECKDVFCNNKIKESTITYNANKKQLRQEMYCTCGCSYSVFIGVDINKGYNKINIINYSEQTRGIILQNYVEKGMGYMKIGKELGISPSYVKKYIKSKDIIPHASNKYKMLEMEVLPFEEVIEFFGGHYLKLILDFPNTFDSRLAKALWDEYKNSEKEAKNLIDCMIENHNKFISDSKKLVIDYRKKKRKVKTCIADNKSLVMAISYLRIFAKKELTNIVGKVTDEDIEKLIVSIEEKQAKGIEVTRKEMWKNHNKEMKYLMQEYPDEVKKIVPNKNNSKNKLGISKKVKKADEIKENDFKDKDAYYEVLIKAISEEIREEIPPVKITKVLIGKKMGISRVGILDEKRYPRAITAMNQVYESSLEYKRRVCKYIIDSKDLSIQDVSLNQIFTEAKIRDSKKRNELKDDVIKYLEEKKKC